MIIGKHTGSFSRVLTQLFQGFVCFAQLELFVSRWKWKCDTHVDVLGGQSTKCNQPGTEEQGLYEYTHMQNYEKVKLKNQKLE